MTAEGMRKSELFWPHHSISAAAKQPGKMVSATEATGGHRTERDRETSAQRGRGRGAGAPSLAQGHPCEEQLGGRRGGERERPRKVSRRLAKKAAGWTRGRARRPRGEAERRRGTHRDGGNVVVRGRGERWGWPGPRPAPRPTQGVGGVTVDTIRIPRSDGRDGREHDMRMDAGQDG